MYPCIFRRNTLIEVCAHYLKFTLYTMRKEDLENLKLTGDNEGKKSKGKQCRTYLSFYEWLAKLI